MVAQLLVSAHAGKYFNGLSRLADPRHKSKSSLQGGLHNPQRLVQGRAQHRGGAALLAAATGQDSGLLSEAPVVQDHQTLLPCLILMLGK